MPKYYTQNIACKYEQVIVCKCALISRSSVLTKNVAMKMIRYKIESPR